MRHPYKIIVDRSFYINREVFTLKAGTIVHAIQFDNRNNKVLIDFGGRTIGWIHNHILTKFEKVAE